MPVGVGLGVGTGAQAAEVARFADGVIVGSALIRCVLDAPDRRTGLSRLRALSSELAGGVRQN
jgi:tryptophan synthase alpha chain